MTIKFKEDTSITKDTARQIEITKSVDVTEVISINQLKFQIEDCDRQIDSLNTLRDQLVAKYDEVVAALNINVPVEEKPVTKKGIV